MRKILILLIFFASQFVFSQNIIPNPDFELYSNCPTALRQIDRTNDWYSASAGTPEYYNACGLNAEILPKNGDGMIGLILYSDYYVDLEYASVKLNDSLKRGVEYCLDFYVRAADEAPVLIDKIGAYFSKDRIKLAYWKPIKKKPQVYTKQILEPNNWVKVESSFHAEGGESYLTIGNFFTKEKIEIRQHSPVRKAGWYAYYFFDEFNLKECQSNQIENPLERPNGEFQKNHITYFESNEFGLTLEELNKLESFINQVPKELKTQLKLEGHTDSDADFVYNIELSKNRVEVVSKIIEKQFSWSLIKLWTGEELPLNDNRNEFEKSRNRRVEISVIP